MKIFDFSPIPYSGGSLSLDQRVRGMLKFGFSWITEMKSQEIVIQSLERFLNNKFTLLRNVPLPGVGITIPFLLIGPHGISVICNSVVKGLFRVNGDSWEGLDNRSHKFLPVTPNLITRTSLMTRAVIYFLKDRGYEIDAQGILVFTNPGMNVETERPNVRILQVDAIERFGARLAQSQPLIPSEDVDTLKTVFETAFEEEKKAKEEKVNPSPDYSQKVTNNVDKGFNSILSPIQKRMNFSAKQWLLLGAFVIVEIIVLLGFLLFIVVTA